jgi:hypothetical protein
MCSRQHAHHLHIEFRAGKLALKLIKKYIVMVFKKVVTAAKARPQ